jgi:Phosphodiester glycosidase
MQTPPHTRLAGSLLLAALALVPALVGCSRDHQRQGAVAATTSAAPAVTTTATTGPAAPAPAPAITVDDEGLITVNAGCVHWSAATTGLDYELTGAPSTWLVAELVIDDHPVHVLGHEGSGAAQCAGALVLEVDDYSFLDVYDETAVAAGVTWRTRTFTALFGRKQSINVLDVDLRQPGVSVRPLPHPGTTGVVTSRLGRDAGAAAAVNGGYFTSTYDPAGLLTVSGQTLATNPTTRPPRSAVGFDAQGQVMFQQVPGGQPWPGVEHAMGAGPNLVTAGQVDMTLAAEGMSTGLNRRHPRTAVGARADGTLVLVTVDGRTTAGTGVDLDELARLMVQLGCTQAINLDGGGSTAMWIDGQPDDGIVSYPSDNGQPDHYGERRVGNALGVFTR